MIEAIILAAGESKRMGRPKPLLQIDGQTALQKIVGTVKRAGIDAIHIVVGHGAEKIIAEGRVTADFVVNENYKKGQFSSLQKGIQALSHGCSAVIVCLVDQPHIDSSWVRLLVEQKCKNNAPIVRLKFGTKTGHPILYSKKIFAEIISMPPEATAKELMTKYADDSVFVDAKSDGILYDADTPADFQFIQRYMIKKASEGLPPDA